VKRFLVVVALLAVACKPDEQTSVTPVVERPSILLVTLDTTRADAIGAATPSFNALAARGVLFRSAYATVPQTLPSHASMLTGFYPAGHGVHENARYLDAAQPHLAEKLKQRGYRTAAFISAFPLAKRFGLSPGFDIYDDNFDDGRAERTGHETADRVLHYLQAPSSEPLFLWVHFYDPHHPYTPPEPYRTRYANNPYLGEVASMDEQVGRVVRAFEQNVRGAKAIVVVADHGEGLGEHGEQQHGNLLYQTTMHVPMVIVGPGFEKGINDTPVSTRRVFHTVLDLAGIDAANSLRDTTHSEVILGEAMQPFLNYGWQPQVMTVEGTTKAIMAGRLEVYDLAADPHETRNLSASANLSRSVRATLLDYPLPNSSAKPSALDDEAKKKLASLGYVSAGVKPVIRADAPAPADMVDLFPVLDRASDLFVRRQYTAVIPLLEQIHTRDPHNLDALLRLASAHSALGHEKEALDAFHRAEALAPDSADVRTYLALHYAKGNDWQRAIPLLERITREEPDRLPPLEALAVIRERQGNVEEAVALREKIYTMRTATPAEHLRLAQLQMSLGQTASAITNFEKARAAQGPEFRNDLELGVLYLASRRFPEARDALDRVPSSHPDYAMALFKRAQVAVLLREPDAAARVDKARRNADAVTRELIARERLFAGM